MIGDGIDIVVIKQKEYNVNWSAVAVWHRLNLFLGQSIFTNTSSHLSSVFD